MRETVTNSSPSVYMPAQVRAFAISKIIRLLRRLPVDVVLQTKDTLQAEFDLRTARMWADVFRSHPDN